jgi:hypothetical protein
VRNGILSIEVARETYGVAVDDALRLDEAGTRELRSR